MSVDRTHLRALIKSREFKGYQSLQGAMDPTVLGGQRLADHLRQARTGKNKGLPSAPVMIEMARLLKVSVMRVMYEAALDAEVPEALLAQDLTIEQQVVVDLMHRLPMEKQRRVRRIVEEVVDLADPGVPARGR